MWCANSSWLEWLDGSALLSWESKGGAGRAATLLDGYVRPLVPFLQPQSKHKDPAKQELMRAKVVKVQRMEYIKAGRIASGTSFFSVDKGVTDIWMVYNGTSCGLNESCTHPTLACLPFERPYEPSYRASFSVTSMCETST